MTRISYRKDRTVEIVACKELTLSKTTSRALLRAGKAIQKKRKSN
jgi:hypothetical protein